MTRRLRVVRDDDHMVEVVVTPGPAESMPEEDRRSLDAEIAAELGISVEELSAILDRDRRRLHKARMLKSVLDELRNHAAKRARS